MVAVFPQFLRPGEAPLNGQAAVLWAIIAVTQVLVYGALAVGADGVRVRVARSEGTQGLPCLRPDRGVACFATW